MDILDLFDLCQRIIYSGIFISQIWGYNKWKSFINALDANFAIQEWNAQSEKQLKVLI